MESKASTWGASCSDVNKIASKLSASNIETVVKAHNDLRRKVAKGEEKRGNPGPQPSASNMMKLVSSLLTTKEISYLSRASIYE